MRLDLLTPPDVVVASLIEPRAGIDLSDGLFADVDNIPDARSPTLPLLSLDSETGCGSSDRLAVLLDVGRLTGVLVPELAELLGTIVSSSALAEAAGCLLYGRLVCADDSGTELAIFANEDIGSGSSGAAACPCFSFATVDDVDRASPELRPVSARPGTSLGEVFCSLPWGATAIRREPNSPLGKSDCAS